MVRPRSSSNGSGHRAGGVRGPHQRQKQARKLDRTQRAALADLGIAWAR